MYGRLIWDNLRKFILCKKYVYCYVCRIYCLLFLFLIVFIKSEFCCKVIWLGINLYNKIFIFVLYIMKFSDLVVGLGVGLVSLEICYSNFFELVRF